MKARSIALHNFVYGLHYCTLIYVLFMRVKVSFDGTSYGLCVSLFVLILLIVFIIFNHIIVALALSLIWVLLFCSGIVYQTLFVLFVTKLKRLVKVEGADNEPLRDIIMKNVVLSGVVHYIMLT